MLGANGFFVFLHSLDEEEDHCPQMAVVYKPPGPILDGAVEELLQSLSRRPVQPDVVAFICVDREDDLDRALDGDGAKSEWLRFRNRASLMRAHFNVKTGGVRVKSFETAKKLIADAFTKQLKEKLTAVIRTGLGSVFQAEEVVLLAPAGYAYQKPSGKREEFFLKPDVALSSSAAVAFVGFALFQKLRPRRLSKAEELRYLFVDTMSIAPVAYALKELITLARGRQIYLMVESFHSYGGMDKVERPLPREAICLISASTSMSMHERWIVDKRASADEVVTLLTALPVTRYAEGALYAIARPKLATSEGPPQLCIRLDGENFLPSAEPPKKVLLSEPAHKTSDTDILRDLASTGVFDAWRRPAGALGAAPRALFVDGNLLIRDERFLNWLDDELRLRVRAATRVIVHQDDLASKGLAEVIRAKCLSRFPKLKLRVESAAEVENLVLSNADGVLVCAAVAGKGSRLLEVSRALRDKHQGPRLYVVGVQVTETREEIRTLPPNLQHAKPVKHEFTVWKTLAIGCQLGRSFTDELKTYYPSTADPTQVPAPLKLRARLLGQDQSIGKALLLPCGPEAAGALELRPGYAYWGAKYDDGPHHAGVLGTVGVLLQRAREDKSVDAEKRLSSSSFRHVLIDPENFARFNDGVIQAALLRNAFPSELDYRMDNAASSRMKSILLRVLGRSHETAGEGALELLLAIALRRLLLEELHEKEVLQAARAPGRSPAMQECIDFILRPLAGDEAESKLPF